MSCALGAGGGGGPCMGPMHAGESLSIHALGDLSGNSAWVARLSSLYQA
ncbi:MAG TPA: hypothetical protein VFM48_08045 [Aquabacterium sp.]|nr:hypothetical protein [Aquabacterium sp.]